MLSERDGFSLMFPMFGSEPDLTRVDPRPEPRFRSYTGRFSGVQMQVGSRVSLLTDCLNLLDPGRT